MKDVVFASDLDNTLLYSRSHKREGDICVEHIEGRAHGFMTPLAIERLREVSQKVRLIPVTTNGAVLLHGGEVDAAWREAHDALIAPAREEIARCHALYLGDRAFIRCRIVDDAYLFVYCADGVDAQAQAAECQKQTSLRVEPSGRKIYFFPPKLTKGAALLELCRRFSPRKVYAAGDTAIDTPLLAAADRAFAAKTLAMKDAAHVRRHEGCGVFAEWLLGEILRELD